MLKGHIILDDFQKYHMRPIVFNNMGILERLNTLKNYRAVVITDKSFQNRHLLLQLLSQGIIENIRIKPQHITFGRNNHLLFSLVIAHNSQKTINLYISLHWKHKIISQCLQPCFRSLLQIKEFIVATGYDSFLCPINK